MFRNWTNAIVNYKYGKGEHGTTNKKKLFEVGYRDEYLCEIDIYCLDQKQENIIQYHLYEAFPMQVADITSAWSETDNFGLLPVQFTFRTFDIRQFGVDEKAVSSATDATDLGAGNAQGRSKPRLGTQKPKRESTGISGRPITLPT